MGRDKALISPLPTCSSRAHEAHIYGMRGYLDELQALPKEPLLVAARLLTPYVAAEPSGATHLDALLSWATLQAYPVPLSWPRGGACTVPLPLELLAVADGPAGERLPVWAASDLMPAGEALKGKEYWHKRYPSEYAEWGKKLAADTGTGRYKEYRIPLSTVRVDAVQAVCIGHAERVQELLTYITHIGKKGTQGFGRVVGWQVVPLDESAEEMRARLPSMRPMPGQGGGLGGFTPPYNHRPWHTALAAR